jgi:hypothetical protein
MAETAAAFVVALRTALITAAPPQISLRFF